jgi:hypothetical protein
VKRPARLAVAVAALLDTGRASAVSYRIEDGRTVVSLDLTAGEAVFVVFRKPATAPAATVPTPAITTVARMDGPWTVSFQQGRGAPATLQMPTLAPLDMQADPRVRYFSGTATYTADVTLPAAKGPLLIDLGRIGDVAEVRVNGTLVGTSWHAPYRLELGSAARPGRNRIEVRVANLWVNRLIGDAQPEAVKTTFTSLPTYKPDAPLRPSGLIGPVSVVQEQPR